MRILLVTCQTQKLRSVVEPSFRQTVQMSQFLHEPRLTWDNEKAFAIVRLTWILLSSACDTDSTVLSSFLFGFYKISMNGSMLSHTIHDCIHGINLSDTSLQPRLQLLKRETDSSEHNAVRSTPGWVVLCTQLNRLQLNRLHRQLAAEHCVAHLLHFTRIYNWHEFISTCTCTRDDQLIRIFEQICWPWNRTFPRT